MMGRLKKLYLQVRGNRVLMAVAEKCGGDESATTEGVAVRGG